MRATVKLILLFLISFGMISCENDDSIEIDLNKFDGITQAFPYEDLQPASNPEYWELNFSMDGNDEVVFSSGTPCLNAEDPEQCFDEFESVGSEFAGFSQGCLPSSCFYFIKYQQAGSNSIVTNPDQVLAFLGDIDSRGDAILLALSHNYHFSTTEKKIGAIRNISTGYQLLVTKMVKSCSPIQVNRFLLNVNTDGTIDIVDEEKYSSVNGCP